MGIINFTAPAMGNFLVKIIAGLVTGCGSIALGIILFTLILKALTLPFDFMSRYSMRKNSLKMEEMRPELEKLQKQYADNKDLYNQKMMALYKKNGYSMFGACLPTIITLVIFIVALNGFTNYSKYQNKLDFYNVTTAYNNVLYYGIDTDDEYVIYKNDKIYLDVEKLLSKTTNGGLEESLNNQIDCGSHTIFFDVKKSGDIIDETIDVGDKMLLSLYTTNSYITCFSSYDVSEDVNTHVKEIIKNSKGTFTTSVESKARLEVVKNITDDTYALSCEKNNFLKSEKGLYFDGYKSELVGKKGEQVERQIDVYNKLVKADAEIYAAEKITEWKANNPGLDLPDGQKEGWIEEFTNNVNADSVKVSEYQAKAEQELANAFILDIQQTMAAKWFREEEDNSFLWIKNIWVTDSPTKHPVESDWNAFKQVHEYKGNNIKAEGYNNVTAKLVAEKSEPNGYFILVALTVIVTFVMQIVTGKAQKAQMELQTVNGQGAQTQKMMKWMMPIMMAIFAFMYTSAFSIYIILSSIISILTTFGINFIVDIKFKKEKEKTDNGKTRSRIYVKKEEEPAPKKKEKKNKDDKFTHESGEDFLSGKADKRHIRGRLK